MICWRGAVTRAIKGKRGQVFLRELLAALDAMPEKALISSQLRDEQGDVCALGAACAKKEVDPTAFDVEDEDHHDPLGRALGIAPALVAEIEYVNDDSDYRREQDPFNRYARVRKWVEQHIAPPSPAAGAPTTKGDR